jgi:hypothetical protein
MTARRLKNFIFRLVVVSAHSYFVPAWGEGLLIKSDETIAPFYKPAMPAGERGPTYRGMRGRDVAAGRWHDLIMQRDATGRASRYPRAPATSRETILDRYM